QRRCAPRGPKIQADGTQASRQTPDKIDVASPSSPLAIFLAQDFPAFDKSGRKIARPRFDPAINELWLEEPARFNFASIQSELPRIPSAVEPDKFVAGPL